MIQKEWDMQSLSDAFLQSVRKYGIKEISMGQYEAVCRKIVCFSSKNGFHTYYEGLNLPSMGRKVTALKIKDPELYKLMKNFLTAYLPDTKQKSAHTIHAYRDALNLYMDFLGNVKSIKLKDVCISDFNQENISAFLRWLHEERGNESTTVNQRLSNIKGFCRYVQKKDVLSFEAYSEICGIAGYKDGRVKDFIWFAIEDVKLVLEQRDMLLTHNNCI